jgi:hypothetical protein
MSEAKISSALTPSSTRRQSNTMKLERRPPAGCSASSSQYELNVHRGLVEPDPGDDEAREGLRIFLRTPGENRSNRQGKRRRVLVHVTEHRSSRWRPEPKSIIFGRGYIYRASLLDRAFRG